LGNAALLAAEKGTVEWGVWGRMLVVFQTRRFDINAFFPLAKDEGYWKRLSVKMWRMQKNRDVKLESNLYS
jgi:hypothetical protein